MILSSLWAVLILMVDTLWASGYEVYDRLSTPYQKFLETLTATYAQPKFNDAAEKNGFKIYSAPRGAPENVGEGPFCPLLFPLSSPLAQNPH